MARDTGKCELNLGTSQPLTLIILLYIPGTMPHHLETLSCSVLTRVLCISIIFWLPVTNEFTEVYTALSQLPKVTQEIIVHLELHARLALLQVHIQNHFITECF